jgi:predicted secreted protein
VEFPELKRGQRAALALLGVALLAWAAGCASAKVYREGAATITGRVGELAVIELDADPATGYSWATVGNIDPRVVTLMETSFVAPPTSAAGAQGRQRWTFRLVGSGSAIITFGYGRTWANAPAEKATMFSVTVR